MVLKSLTPKPVSIWLDAVEFGVLATLIMWGLTVILVWENNRLLRRLVDLHRLR